MLYSGFFCDECGKSVGYSSDAKEWLPNKTDLVRLARKEGWTVGKKLLCPKCRKGGRERKK